MRWTILKPTKASSNLPRLTVQDDASVFVSGDQSKRDLYTLQLSTNLKGITAIRLEALPDDRLPHGGPGRVFYEGPAGDFFLSEVTVTAGGKAVPLKHATASGNEPRGGRAAIDGDPQTGWSINGGQGQAHSAVFRLAAPLDDARDLVIQLLFERYHAAGLGRFRISVTTDPRPVVARDTPAEIEDSLVTPEQLRTPEQKAQLHRHYLMVAPELAKERAAIEQLRKGMPSYATTLITARAAAGQPTADLRPQPGRVPPADRAGRARRAVDTSLAAKGRSSQPAGFGALARFARQSAHWSRDHEPPVGHVLRPGTGPHHRGFRLSRRVAQPPRAARLARPGAVPSRRIIEANA